MKCLLGIMNWELKSIIASIICVVVFQTGYTQVPQAFSYQGVARDVEGTEISNRPIGLRLSIRNNSSSGVVEYQEEHAVVTNQFGLFSLAVGQGTPSLIDFDQVDWSIGQKWMQIEMDTAGGTDYQDMGASQLLSTPYALYAGNAGVSSAIWNEEDGGDISYTSGNVGIGTTSPEQKLSVADTIQSTIGGFMFPDGSVQSTASISNETFWRKNGTSTIEPSVSDNIRINADSIQTGLNSSVLMGIVKDNSTITATGVLGSPITGINNVDYQYDSNLRGPYVEFSNYKDQSVGGSSMGVMIATLDAGGTGANVILNNVNSGPNAADFAIQCEFNGPNSTDYNEVARFTSEGNVGIGISEPEQKLSVADTIQSTIGGFMFPDGSVQATAALGGLSLWEYQGDDIFLKDSLEGKLVIGRSTVFDQNAVFQVQSIENAPNGNGGVATRVATFEHNIDYTYDSSTIGPHIKFANRAIPSQLGNSMSLEIITLSSGFTSECAVELTNVNRGLNAADLTIQTEHEEPGAGSFMREVARFTSEGNVGIGISEPEQKLSVADTIQSTIGGFMFPDGTVQSTAADSSYWRFNSSENAISYTLGSMIVGPEDNYGWPQYRTLLVSEDNEEFTTGGGIFNLGGRALGVFHNVNFSYDPTKIGPGMILGNYSVPSSFNSVVSIDLATYSSTSGGKTSVALTNINRGEEHADFAIQVEDGQGLSGQSTFMREVARFTSEGNVGIGISEPEQKLSVADTIQSTLGGFMFPDGSVQSTAALGGLSLWEYQGDDIFLKDSLEGRLVIGRSAQFEQNAMFQVWSEANVPNDNGGVASKVATFVHNVDFQYDQENAGPRLTIENRDRSNPEGSSMSLEISTVSNDIIPSTGSIELTNVNRGLNAADFTIQTEHEEPGQGLFMTEVARFTSEGNVGIGISQPEQKLSVAGMIESTVGGYKFPDGTVQATAFFKSAADSLLTFDGTNLIVDSDDGATLIGTTTTNEGFTNLFVFSDGDEPFSGGSPGVRSKAAVFAHDVDWVYDPEAIGPRLKIRNEAIQSSEGSSISLELSSASSSPRSGCVVLLSSVSKGRNSADFTIQTENNGSSPDGVSFSEVARFTSEGTVGIGTDTPKEKLHVASGNVYLDDASNGVIMTSPNGSCWLMQVDDSGAPTFSNITCP